MYREIRRQKIQLAPLLEEAELFGVENIGRWNRAHRMLNDQEIAELREAVEEKRPIEDLDAAGEETTKPLLNYKSLCLPEWVPKAMYGELLRIYDFLHAFHAMLHYPDDNGEEGEEGNEGSVDAGDDGHLSFSDLVKAICAPPNSPSKEQDLEKFDPIPSLTRLLKKLIGAKFRTFGLRERAAVGSARERDVEEGKIHISKSGVAYEYKRQSSIHGVPLEKLPIEPATLTEILRLTLKTASYCSKTNSYQLPGKDVLHAFSLRDSVVTAMLQSSTVYELSAEQRLALVRAFVDQLSLFVAFRERCEVKRAQQEKKEEEVLNWRPPRVMKPPRRNSKAITPSAIDTRQEHFPWNAGDEQNGQKDRCEESVTAKPIEIEVSSTSDASSSVVPLEEPLFYIGEDRYFRHYYCFKMGDDEEGGLVLLIEDVVSAGKAMEIAAAYEHYSTDELSGRFSVYCAKEGIQPLLDTLCMHGVREFELAKRLLYYKATLERGMNVMHQVFADELSFLIEAWDGSNLGSASRDVIPLTETMRRGFIAFLLDLEERVFIERFGSLNCDGKRQTWRAALKQAGDTIGFSNGAFPVQGSKKPQGEVLISIDNLKSRDDVTEAQKLGVALLQIVQGLKFDCLQEPFIVKNNKADAAGYVAWQREVARSQSISSLVLLTKPLMRSINWEWVDMRRFRQVANVGIPYRGVVNYLPNKARMSKRQQEKAARDAISAVSSQVLPRPNHVPTEHWQTYTEFLARGRLDSIPHRVKRRQATFVAKRDRQSSGGDSDESSEDDGRPVRKRMRKQTQAQSTAGSRKYTLRSSKAKTQQ